VPSAEADFVAPFFTRHCRAGLSYCAPSGLAYADQIPHNSLIASGNGSANTALGDRKLILDEEERRIFVQRCGIGPSPMSLIATAQRYLIFDVV
jgi:hypothetical protein